MFSVLVTGSNRGIGLELVKKLASHSDPPKLILATCRNPEAASELTEVSKKYNSVKILKLGKQTFETKIQIFLKDKIRLEFELE